LVQFASSNRSANLDEAAIAAAKQWLFRPAARMAGRWTYWCS
jgi:outer membrane biosynthesis protein TonB